MLASSAAALAASASAAAAIAAAFRSSARRRASWIPKRAAEGPTFGAALKRAPAAGAPRRTRFPVTIAFAVACLAAEPAGTEGLFTPPPAIALLAPLAAGCCSLVALPRPGLFAFA